MESRNSFENVEQIYGNYATPTGITNPKKVE